MNEERTIRAYAFESQGGSNCWKCGAVIPKGLVVFCTGMYDYCPVCTQELPKHITQEPLDKFWRETWNANGF